LCEEFWNLCQDYQIGVDRVQFSFATLRDLLDENFTGRPSRRIRIRKMSADITSAAAQKRPQEHGAARRIGMSFKPLLPKSQLPKFQHSSLGELVRQIRLIDASLLSLAEVIFLFADLRDP
jgi:hypothetical protein